MNIVLWGIFYLITGLGLIYFFIKEKKVIEYIREKEENILKNVPKNKKTLRENLVGNILTLIALAITGVFYFLVDKTPDPYIAIKIWGIYGIFIINIIFYLLRTQHEWIFLSNLVMMILGKLMFNIMDMNFYIYLCINILISFILIYIFRNEISLKKAVHRIDTTFTAIILVGLIQIFYIGNYVIPTASMDPTIAVKDRVFANMAKYKFTSPKVGQIIAFKEPMQDKVMYTKRITGAAGQTLQIENIKGVDINGRQEPRGEMYIDGEINKVLSVRGYEPSGLMFDKKIYIPKKGDKVKLDKIIALSKEEISVEIVNEIRVVWEGYYNGDMFQELTGKEFLAVVGTEKGFKDIIGNNEVFVKDDNRLNVYYTFLLKVEGKEEIVLPIMDLKYDDEKFLKLLNGETIELTSDYYMAMGDNTGNSLDSRYFGYVSGERIKGELLLRWWPLNRLGFLK